MISFIEPQPAGPRCRPGRAGGRNLFADRAFLSKAQNFEYRPQQQQMAVAVAQALENKEHLVVEAGTGVGKSLAYLIPAILFAVANNKKAVVSTHTINLQEQLIEKDLPMLEADAARSKFNFTMLKGRAELSLHAPTAQGDAAGGQPVHLAGNRGARAHLRMVARQRRTAAFRISTSSPTRKSGRRSVPSADFARRNFAGINPISQSEQRRLLFSARAQPDSVRRRAGFESHAVLHAPRRHRRRNRKAAFCSRTISSSSTKRTRSKHVASKHIGLSVSSGQLRYALQRLWNPRTEKGLLATLRQGEAVKLVADLLQRGG